MLANGVGASLIGVGASLLANLRGVGASILGVGASLLANGDKRVIVLLELLGKANKVGVSRDWIARAA